MEPTKRMKITPTVWDFMLDFMTEHPEMATGKFEGPNIKQHLRKLWVELTNKLNSLGHGAKTASKWQKSFVDWKYNIKQKYAEIRTQRAKTGSGKKKLTAQEERLMELIGGNFLEGDEAKEIRLGTQTPTLPNFDAGPSTSEQIDEDIVYIPHSPQPVEIVVCERLSPFSEVSEASDALSPPELPPQPSTSDTYIPYRSRPVSGSVIEQFQSDTLDELRCVNNNLRDISNNIQRLTDAIIELVNRNK